MVARVVALVVWIIAALGFMTSADFAAMDQVTILALGMACFMPAVVISLGLLVASAAHRLSAETQHLQGSVDALRQSLLQQAAPEPTPPAPPQALFLSQRARLRPPSSDSEPRLELALPDSGPETLPDLDQILRAVHFPQNAEDAEGFEALRLALSSPRLAPLIRAAQDVLTRLSEEGIYMDDLRPDRARPEIWRAFAQGARGAAVASLGGVRDRSCLAITSARMRTDPEFRATAHNFLREFDRLLTQIEPRADDNQISTLTETRSARAFMILGRVAGIFNG